jgi:hypothetical protein
VQLGPDPISVQWGGRVSELSWRTSAAELVARRMVPIAWHCRPSDAMPSELLLVADMPAMSHGPTRALLRREGEYYRGTLLFVMGGRWELRLFAGERELLRGWIDVKERA